jgi:hypothetical protein
MDKFDFFSASGNDEPVEFRNLTFSSDCERSILIRLLAATVTASRLGGLFSLTLSASRDFSKLPRAVMFESYMIKWLHFDLPSRIASTPPVNKPGGILFSGVKDLMSIKVSLSCLNIEYIFSIRLTVRTLVRNLSFVLSVSSSSLTLLRIPAKISEAFHDSLIFDKW